MTTRRGFLQMLCAAPVALPVLAKEAASAAPHSVASTGIDWSSLDFEPIRLCTNEVDVSAIIRTQQHVELRNRVYDTMKGTNMSDFADDVAHLEADSFRVVSPDEMPAARFAVQTDASGKAVLVDRGAFSIDLTRHRLVYLGSPYTKYAAGLDAAFRDVSAIAAEMLRDGVKVYSPIAHTHPIAIHGNLDPRNHDIWLPFDQAMMDASDAMVVADMDGWRESYGVRFEIDTFRAAGKPVYFRDRAGFVSVLDVDKPL